MPRLNPSFKRYLDHSMLPHLWCSGCGNGIVLSSLARALAELGLKRNRVVVVTGIGCWGKADDYLSTNALHGTHGRALAFATGIKAANPKLCVIVLMGDGDGATIGGNHLIHAARRNIDLLAVVVNNHNYGMTGGQVSATTPAGAVTSTTAYGNPEREFDLCELVMAAGANYVARGTAYHVPQLDRLLREGIEKKGFSFVEVMSPCPTQYGRRNQLGGAVKMMEWLRDHAVPVKSFREKRDDLPPGSFPIGKLHEGDDPDFNTRYRDIQARAQKEGQV